MKLSTPISTTSLPEMRRSPPFDRAAAGYDAGFTDRPVARNLRRVVWTHLEAAFQSGDRALDLGCGTGEDALHLAESGIRVYAIDESKEMLAMAQAKADSSSAGRNITCIHADLESFATTASTLVQSPVDGAYSNFGALNCLEDRTQLARSLATWIRPGGMLVLVLMGPYCPWEWMWYAPRGRLKTAFRRFSQGQAAALGDGQLPVWYPSPRQLRREFMPWFRQISLIGLGVLLPPSFADDLLEKRPGALDVLARWDMRLGRHFPWTWLNDHYVMSLERTDAEVA